MVNKTKSHHESKQLLITNIIYCRGNQLKVTLPCYNIYQLGSYLIKGSFFCKQFPNHAISGF